MPSGDLQYTMNSMNSLRWDEGIAWLPSTALQLLATCKPIGGNLDAHYQLSVAFPLMGPFTPTAITIILFSLLSSLFFFAFYAIHSEWKSYWDRSITCAVIINFWPTWWGYTASVSLSPAYLDNAIRISSWYVRFMGQYSNVLSVRLPEKYTFSQVANRHIAQDRIAALNGWSECEWYQTLCEMKAVSFHIILVSELWKTDRQSIPVDTRWPPIYDCLWLNAFHHTL